MFSKLNGSKKNLELWRSFRKSSADCSVDEIVRGFNTEPDKIRYIDYYTPDSWPNVFEIVTEQMFCQSGISLILGATLHNLQLIKTNFLRFDVISNHITGTEGLVLFENNLYHNFLPGEIHTVEAVKNNATIFESHIITVDKLFD